MNIDWASFSPASALIGGALIGLAAVFLMIFNGRITGISGIVGQLLQKRVEGDSAWRVAFVAGLIVAPLVYQLFAVLPDIRIDADWSVLVLAGLLVGFGSRYGSGCTSGHGVCGLSQWSRRSILATLTFMSTGFVTVFVVRHLFG